MKFSETVRLARQITETSGVIVSRNQWLNDAGDYKAPDFNPKENPLPPEQTELVSFKRVLDSVVQKIQRRVEVYAEPTGIDQQYLNHIHGYILNEAIPKVVITPCNTCWFRFAAVKELMHLYAYIAEDDQVRKASLITSLAKQSRTIVPTPVKDLDDETAAIYMAIEVLIPWEMRKQGGQIDQMRKMFGENNYYPIAKALMIPENVVQHFFDGEKNLSALSFTTNLSV